MQKCKFIDDIVIKPDGVHELDPCCYEEIERWGNVTVVIQRCKNCGNIDIVWYKQEDTIKLDPDEFDPE